MNTSPCLSAVLLALLAAVFPGRVAGAELPEDPKELLTLLRAKDARFDNAHLYYIRRGVYTPPEFPYWKFPGQKPSEEPSKPMPFRFKEQITVRGSDTTFVRDVYTTVLTPPDSGATFRSHQKWSVAEGLVREFLESKEYDDRSMTIKRGGSDQLSHVSGQRREIEFSLGFGFGSRIKSISSVTRKGKERVLEGEILLWSDDQSRFRLTLDEDLVVRLAVVEVEAEGNQTRYDVSTEGSVKSDDFVFAKTGHYTRTALGLKKPATKRKVPFQPSITDEFDVDFKSAKFHLGDEEYKALTKMETPPGTHVMDYVTNKRYIVDRNNQVSKEGPLVPGGR